MNMQLPEGFEVKADRLALHARIVDRVRADPAQDYLSAWKAEVDAAPATPAAASKPMPLTEPALHLGPDRAVQVSGRVRFF